MAEDINKRMNFFNRQFLRASDFQDEQSYHIDRRRRHNRTMHSPGVAEGLDVTGSPGANEVLVSPGMAVDENGCEIVSVNQMNVPLINASGTCHIYISYQELLLPLDETHEGGVPGHKRITEQPLFTCVQGSISGAVLLATVVLNSGKLVSMPDNNVRVRAEAAFGSNEINSSTGIRLSAEDRPVITRGWDKFESGKYTGLGRWGVFMEPHTLTFGIPNVPGKTFSFKAFNENSTGQDLITIGNTDKESFLKVEGSINFKNTRGGFARLTGEIFSEDDPASMPPTARLVLSELLYMPLTPISPFSFEIGYASTLLLEPGEFSPARFIPTFSMNQKGDVDIKGTLTANAFKLRTGEKAGYLVDYFVNAVGDILEQGDVVVIGGNSTLRHWADGDRIPIPEVDLTDRSYDTRVCGIVAYAVTIDDLPYSILEMAIAEENTSPATHPLEALASKRDEQMDVTQVPSGQLGKMVTLGAFAYCKVDADIAPIDMGDLLTTSPTKGHAQKVSDDNKVKAIGAIIGKAMGKLDKGKGKIPILVMLQ